MTIHPQKAAWPVCDVCGQPVDAPADGLLSISRLLAPSDEGGALYRDRDRERERVGPNGQRFKILTAEDLVAPLPEMEQHQRKHWLWAHVACTPPDANIRVTADRIETSAKALELTLRLMEQEWLASTDWADTMRRFILADRRVSR